MARMGCRYAIQGHSTFKVNDVGTSRKHDFLLVNNTNSHPILHRFPAIADYWSNYRL